MTDYERLSDYVKPKPYHPIAEIKDTDVLVTEIHVSEFLEQGKTKFRSDITVETKTGTEYTDPEYTTYTCWSPFIGKLLSEVDTDRLPLKARFVLAQKDGKTRWQIE